MTSPQSQEEPAYRALDPEMEQRMKSRRQAARQARSESAQKSEPRQWGPYELVEEIGEGPSAVAWRGRRPGDDQELAIKLLRKAVVAGEETPGARAAVARDLIPQLAQVDHSGFVSLLGVEEHGGRTGIVMEYVEGETLDSLLREGAGLPYYEVLDIGIALCGALAAVHEAGIVHGDVKTRNVLRRRAGDLLLMDMNTARESGSDRSDRAIALSGSPQFMAPELLNGAEASVASDLYALGVVLFQATARQFPVKGPMVRQLREAHREGRRLALSQARPGVPAPLADAVEKALAPEPNDRFGSAVEMGDALRQVRAMDLSAPATSQGRGWASLPAALRGAIVVGGVGLFLVLMWLRSR